MAGGTLFTCLNICPSLDPLFKMENSELVKYSLASLRKNVSVPRRRVGAAGACLESALFEADRRAVILKLMPDMRSPVQGFYVATMAQIYPEDRGTNYSIREGVQVGELVPPPT